MDILITIIGVYIGANLLGLWYVHMRLNAQDKYLSTYLRSFAKYNNDELPPFLDSMEIEKETKEPEVYSPRHDPETIMQGKVIDHFD